MYIQAVDDVQYKMGTKYVKDVNKKWNKTQKTKDEEKETKLKSD